MVAVPNIKLSSGHDMPQVGFGLWKVDTSIAADTVYNAIKVGYRLFDGACGKSIERLPREALHTYTQIHTTKHKLATS
jgi:D-xylose reductase